MRGGYWYRCCFDSEMFGYQHLKLLYGKDKTDILNNGAFHSYLASTPPPPATPPIARDIPNTSLTL